MIDSIMYFVTYGLWCLFLFSFLFYWIVRLIDWIIYDITGGDFKWPLRKRLIKLPILNLGEICEYGGRYRAKSFSFLDFIMVLTSIGCVLLCLMIIACLESETPIYLAIHNVSEGTMSYLGWVLIPIIFMVIRSTLKNLYKVTKHLNKQIKTTLEQVDKEDS